MATSIKNSGSSGGLNTSDATALATDMLAGKTAYVNGNKITGTITSKSAETITPGTTNKTIAAGQYLSGAQTIAGDADLVDTNIRAGANIFGVAGNSNVVNTSAGTATAAQILSGQKAFVKGTQVIGTMPSKAAQTYTPGTTAQTIAAGQYLSGAQTVAGDANLVAGNIKAGTSIFGVLGTLAVSQFATGTFTFTSGDIKLDITPSTVVIIRITGGYNAEWYVASTFRDNYVGSFMGRSDGTSYNTSSNFYISGKGFHVDISASAQYRWYAMA